MSLSSRANLPENCNLAAAPEIIGQDPDPLPDLVTRLKTVLRGMPGPVAVVTTRDAATGQPAGLAASAVIPVCMAPPSMLVCVNRSASAHAVIEMSGKFCINIIGPTHTGLVEPFSNTSLRHKRFSGAEWSDRHGMPYLPAAPANLFCMVRTTLLFGTHEAFIGEVFDLAAAGNEKPVGWLDGGFVQFTPLTHADRPPFDSHIHRSSDKNGALP